MVDTLFRWREYLQQEKIVLCSAAAVCIYTALLLGIVGADFFLRLFVLTGMILIFAGILILRGLYYRQRLKRLKRLVTETKDKYLCGEMLPKPATYTEALYFELMKEISRSAITEVEESRKRELEYREYIEQFVHEVKTPLMAATLMVKNECDSPGIRHALKQADNQIESILYFAKLDSLDKDIVVRESKLEEIVTAVLLEEMDLLIMAGISASVDVSGTVLTDPVFFRMVLRQILVNASKYCKGCKLTIFREGKSLVICDNGPGISQAELSRVTKKGYVGSEGRKRPGSTGMGLYIASCICQKLCIDMKIESKAGEYTRFTFVFSG